MFEAPKYLKQFSKQNVEDTEKEIDDNLTVVDRLQREANGIRLGIKSKTILEKKINRALKILIKEKSGF